MKYRILLFIVVILFFNLRAFSIVIDVDKAVQIALDNSEELMMANNRLEQAKLNRQIARTAYLPDFSGNVTGAWLPQSEYLGMSLRMKGVYMAGINLTQPIFAGGKIIAANRLAGIGISVAREQHRQARMNIISNTMVSYWSYVAVLAKVEMMQSYRALIDTAYIQTKAALDAGMSTRNELLRIEARQSQIIYQQEQALNGAELCRMALCNSMSLPTDTEIEIADIAIPIDIPQNLYEYDLYNRPEIQLLHADINAKKQEVNITRADYLPTLGLQAGWSAFGNLKFNMVQQLPDGSYMPFSQNVNSNGWSLMMSLQVPIFHWGEGYKKIKHAKINVENARLNLENTSRQLDLQVQQAITNIKNGTQLVESAQKAVNQADAALSSTTISYNLGMAPITDLLDAQAQWHTSRANFIEACVQLRINIVDYYSVTGNL